MLVSFIIRRVTIFATVFLLYVDSYIRHGLQQYFSSHLARKEQTLKGGRNSPQVIWPHCLQTTAVKEEKCLDESVAAAHQVHSHSGTQITLIVLLKPYQYFSVFCKVLCFRIRNCLTKTSFSVQTKFIQPGLQKMFKSTRRDFNLVQCCSQIYYIY